MTRKVITREQAEEFYANWKDYPDCKVRLGSTMGCPENVWAKDLGGGLVGINNFPLNTAWPWQDICHDCRPEPQVLYRRWNAKVHYSFNEPGDAEEGKAIRSQLRKALAHLGFAGFWCEGVGFVAMPEEWDEAVAKLQEAVAALPEELGAQVLLPTEDDDVPTGEYN